MVDKLYSVCILSATIPVYPMRRNYSRLLVLKMVPAIESLVLGT